MFLPDQHHNAPSRQEKSDFAGFFGGVGCNVLILLVLLGG
nr:MAG TPA: hypothetical protein [Caudoviricetes sp.]